MQLRAAVSSHRGLVRQTNEDSYFVRRGLYAVCDGMGGARAGEVASEIACRELVAIDPATAGPEELRAAIEEANLAIVRRSFEEERLFGMGTTLTAALVSAESLYLAHVGDSRAYLMHGGTLTQLTSDHSWVAEMVRRGELTEAQAAVHPHRSVITKALGTDDGADPDIFEVPVVPGDRLLLCSDGLSGMVSDADIAEILARDQDPQTVADLLVQAALAGGGEDNVTVVVLDIQRDGTSSEGVPAGDAVDDDPTLEEQPVADWPGLAQPGDEEDTVGQAGDLDDGNGTYGADEGGTEQDIGARGAQGSAQDGGTTQDGAQSGAPERGARPGGEPPGGDEILIGPTDRGVVMVTRMGRGRLSRAGMRARLGSRVGPILHAGSARSGGKYHRAQPAAPAGWAAGAASPEARVAPESLTLAHAVVDSSTVASPAPTVDGGTKTAGTLPGAAAVAAVETAATAPSAARPRRWTRRRWITVATIVVLVLAVAIIAFAIFNSTVYYVGASEGAVALYHGLPGSVLGIALSSVIERGTVSYDSLAPYLQARIDAHDLVSKEEGQLFLRSLSVPQ